MLSKVGKGIRGGICHSIYWCAKVIKKCMKDLDKHRESWYLKYWDVYNLYGWVLLRKLPLNNFEWI